jgi:dCMP deaminase
MTDRIGWTQYFMGIARVVGERATCDRLQVGCVITRQKRILATGYNGAISGEDHCDDVGHLMVDGHCARVVHAEANAVAQAARYGIPLEGSSVYITASPCLKCCQLLVSSGVVSIVYDKAYKLDSNVTYLCDRLAIGLISCGD